MTAQTPLDKEIRWLFNHCKAAIENASTLSIRIGTVPTELASLKRYMEVYEKTEIDLHTSYFEKIYAEYRDSILLTLVNDAWLREGDVTIRFGAGISSTQRVTKNIYVALSSIYKSACATRSRVEKLKLSSNNADLLRPHFILLHLLRIFYLLQSGPDKPPLGEMVSKLEIGLNLPRTIVSPAVEKPSTGSISQLLHFAQKMLADIGMPIDSNAVIPSEQEVEKMISGILQSEATTRILSNVAGVVKTNPDVQNMMKNVMDEVNNPQVVEGIVNSLTPALMSTQISTVTPTAVDPSTTAVPPATPVTLDTLQASDSN
jgi:hypothetical protein